MERPADKVFVQLLRFVLRPATQTMVVTFRCADDTTAEIEIAADCADHIRRNGLVGRAMAELVRMDPALAPPPDAVPSVPIQGCKVMVNEAGMPALLFDVAGSSQFAVQLCQVSATRLIGELTNALNAQPPPGKAH